MRKALRIEEGSGTVGGRDGALRFTGDALCDGLLITGSPFSGNPFPALRWPWFILFGVLLLFFHSAIHVWQVKLSFVDTSLRRVRSLLAAIHSLVFVFASRWLVVARPVSYRPTPYIAPNLSVTCSQTICFHLWISSPFCLGQALEVILEKVHPRRSPWGLLQYLDVGAQ